MYLGDGFFLSALLDLREGVELDLLLADLDTALEGIIAEVLLRRIVKETIGLLDILTRLYVVRHD